MSEFELMKYNPEDYGNQEERARYTKYPWHKMEVNDCFIIKNPKTDAKSGFVRNYVSNINKKCKPDKEFRQRKIKDGLLIWRSK